MGIPILRLGLAGDHLSMGMSQNFSNRIMLRNFCALDSTERAVIRHDRDRFVHPFHPAQLFRSHEVTCYLYAKSALHFAGLNIQREVMPFGSHVKRSGPRNLISELVANKLYSVTNACACHSGYPCDVFGSMSQIYARQPDRSSPFCRFTERNPDGTMAGHKQEIHHEASRGN